MPEKIGKYQIVERLGSGGMGTIYKAHDPVLDRLVALKMISTEIEITDELRARFFREAQACARLSHPNIVTVYAMGDEDGQLFIVMELLEGEDLKHLIAQRKALPLQDTLSIMVQVCDGLHYAHQMGIVHRDIKPGNIFLLRSGQVKILDFGIAQMANAEAGLTRAGLIMGSLRYISPEQVRGRVDHRSDIFSLGAVLYEFLSMRPPFTGEDPIHLLEQLRTEEPPALDQLDPTIPSELAAVVARAMRKDPAERFTDLEQMRSQLEEVQRGLTEEARRFSARVCDQRGQLLQLRAALVERVGPSREDEPVPTLDERARLATIQALERDLSARIEALQARITRADSLAPTFRRATELLQAGQLAEAVGEFEAILAEMPEHARALDGLEQARAQVELQRRRQLAAKLGQDARAALDEGSLTLCLEILEEAAQITPPAEAVQGIASLREVAEAAVAAREAVRRAQQEAEGAGAHMEQVRRAAQCRAGPQYAPSLWREAEAKSTEAATALVREAYVEARQSFEVAITVYRRFEEVAREAQRREHETAEQARSMAAQSRQRAQAEVASQYAREQWDAAEAKSAEAQIAYAQKGFGRAGEMFNEGFDLYGRAEEAAREARQREIVRAEEARRQVARSRDRAETAGAPHYTREQWDAAEARLTEAEAAFVRHAYPQAGQAFDGAAAMYRSLEEAAREARRHEREVAEQGRELMVRARRGEELRASPQYAPGFWAEAEAKSAEAEAAFEREAYTEANEAFAAAAGAFRRAEEVAREGREREAAERARVQMAQVRERAQAAGAPRYTRELWAAAQAKFVEAQAAFVEKSLSLAAGIFDECAVLYARAEEASHEARGVERRRAETARARATKGQSGDTAAAAPRHATSLWNEATAKFADAEAAFFQEQYATAADAFDRALALYQEAEKQAREERRRQREQAEQTRQAMAERRRGAAAVAAASHAPSDWQEAEASAASGEAAFAREAYAEASGAFHQSAGLYHRTEERARDVVRALAIAHAHAETVRDAVALARHAAQDAQASKYASEQWRAGESIEAQASATLSRQDYAAARSLFSEARRHFAAAAQAANIAAGVEGRRADAMVSDARRLLDSGDVAACLRRLSEVLELRPGHAGAEALRLEAEQRQREVANTQDVTIYSRWSADSLEETIPQSERALGSPTVVAESPAERTEAPTEQVEAPAVRAEPAVLVDAPTVFDGQPAVVASAPGASVEAMPPRWPMQRRGKRATGVPVADVRTPAPGSRRGLRRVTMATVGGLAVIGLAALLWLPRGPSTGPSPGPPVKQGRGGSPTSTASPQLERADPSVRAPSPRIVDSPLTPRQALYEVFEGRNPEHSVTATLVKDAVRIGRDNLGFSITSSRPGYVYVMVARSNGSDVELLLPNAVETNNYIEPGRPLKLPGPQWPLKAQGPPGTNGFLAIVSDGPRDFGALGPVSENIFKKFRLGGRRLDRGPSGSPPLFAGTVACVSATRCSESYGAVVFSIGTVGQEPEARQAGRRPPAATAPATRARHEVSPRCSNILERASLGDLLTDEEQTMLTRDCQ